MCLEFMQSAVGMACLLHNVWILSRETQPGSRKHLEACSRTGSWCWRGAGTLPSTVSQNTYMRSFHMAAWLPHSVLAWFQGQASLPREDGGGREPGSSWRLYDLAKSYTFNTSARLLVITATSLLSGSRGGQIDSIS